MDKYYINGWREKKGYFFSLLKGRATSQKYTNCVCLVSDFTKKQHKNLWR